MAENGMLPNGLHMPTLEYIAQYSHWMADEALAESQEALASANLSLAARRANTAATMRMFAAFAHTIIANMPEEEIEFIKRRSRAGVLDG